jgi:histidine triad (HIT) family protein
VPLVLPSQTPCSFCENFQGRNPWHGAPAVIFEDELIYVFLAPAALGGMEGHTLVTTKLHQATILDLTREQESTLGQVVARTARMIDSAADPDGILVQQHNGESAFQTVPHIHFHVIPMREGATFPPADVVDITPADERAVLATRLREHWDRV